jgi:hypothetical protein
MIRRSLRLAIVFSIAPLSLALAIPAGAQLAGGSFSRRYLQFEVAGPTGKGGRGAAPLNWSTRRCGLTVTT